MRKEDIKDIKKIKKSTKKVTMPCAVYREESRYCSLFRKVVSCKGNRLKCGFEK